MSEEWAAAMKRIGKLTTENEVLQTHHAHACWRPQAVVVPYHCHAIAQAFTIGFRFHRTSRNSM